MCIDISLQFNSSYMHTGKPHVYFLYLDQQGCLSWWRDDFASALPIFDINKLTLRLMFRSSIES